MQESPTNIVHSSDSAGPSASLYVEVIADFVCPYSYLGKRRLEGALNAVHGPSEVSWYPYQLNPDIPAAGLPFDTYLTQRFGSPVNVEPVLEHLTAEGADAGIEFRFDSIRHVPNTLPAHQLMQLAETLGVDQSALAERLFRAFFEEGRDLGETETLVNIATRFGIAAADVRTATNSAEMQKLILSREAQVRASGMAGVPGFLINRRLLIVGAQQSDSIVSAFDRAMFGEGADGLVSPVLH